MPAMEHKTVELAEFKMDPGTGEFSGYASVFGVLDAGGDIVDKGAYRKAIPAFLKDGFISWSHDWTTPIAYPTSAKEDGHGLLLGGRFHSTPDAQAARTIASERAEAGLRTGLSIGYGVEEEEPRKDGRHLKVINPLYEVGFVMVPMNRESNLMGVKGQSKGAIASHGSPTSDAAWDGAEEEADLPDDAGAATLRRMYAWLDPDGDPATKAAYKFPHHEVADSGAVGAANLLACSAGIAALNGARGGADIPEADRAGVFNHLARHLRDGERDVPELRGLDPDAGASLADSVARFLGDGEALTAQFKTMAELREKEGRTLSDANRKRLVEIAGAISELLVADEPRKAVTILALAEEARFLGVDLAPVA